MKSYLKYVNFPVINRIYFYILNLMKKILVTGGAGFIGSHLIDSLLSENIWQVTVVDNFNDFYAPEIKRANIAHNLSNPNFRLYETDICSASVSA